MASSSPKFYMNQIQSKCREPRGIGFLEYIDARDAEDAKDALDRAVIHGREASFLSLLFWTITASLSRSFSRRLLSASRAACHILGTSHDRSIRLRCQILSSLLRAVA